MLSLTYRVCSELGARLSDCSGPKTERDFGEVKIRLRP